MLQAKPGMTCTALIAVVLFVFLNTGHAQRRTNPVPYDTLTLGSDGNLYGTSGDGYGAIFRLTPSGTRTVLHAFTGGDDGWGPYSALVQGRDGNFYGSTFYGGAGANPLCNHGCGTIFRITPSGQLTVLWSFGGGNDGWGPHASLIEGEDGVFYGTTEFGGARNLGTVFKVTSSGAETTLHSFNGDDGAYPVTNLTPAYYDDFFGTTSEGGFLFIPGIVTGGGVAFKISRSGDRYSVVSESSGKNLVPQGNLVVPRSYEGWTWGTSQGGGDSKDGSISLVSQDPLCCSLRPPPITEKSFNTENANGYFPMGGVALGRDGSTLYGTTYFGGAGGNGTIFSSNPNRASDFRLLYTFQGGASGGNPFTAPVQDSSGNLYGTAGLSPSVIYKLTPTGQYSVLYP